MEYHPDEAKEFYIPDIFQPASFEGISYKINTKGFFWKFEFFPTQDMLIKCVKLFIPDKLDEIRIELYKQLQNEIKRLDKLK